MKAKMILYGALVLALAACSAKNTEREKAPIRVVVEKVSAQAVASDGKTYVGVVEENQATVVSYTTMGTLKHVAVSEGQAVGRGQLIAELDDTQARNMLAAAEAQNRQAEDALQRYKLLHDEGSMTEAQWVEVQSKVDQARSELAIARRNVADSRLEAPVSGIIGKRYLAAGETALPSQPVVSILDISSVKVKIAVPEREMKDITSTTPTTIFVEAIGREFHGGLIEKGVQADALTHTYDVRVRVDNKGRDLLPGMVAKVKTLSPSSLSGKEQSPSTTTFFTLPITAVQQRADGTFFAWTVSKDNTAHRTTVTTGTIVGNRIEILSGLSDGQRVVTEGCQKLSEGTKTQPLP
ncbi:MAG: efflux RND transporter periplasmic adaptor subunit [Prevotella sp.]|jgi:RND family efflux transporter MFP subunit|nr:efflux RND transporter periplasmic adaptor subunit [Prevotella sp.]